MAKKKRDIGGLFFLAGLFLGLGVGMYYGRPDAGVLVGLGVGFAAMAISYAFGK